MIIDQKAIERVNCLLSPLLENGYVDYSSMLQIVTQEGLGVILSILDKVGLEPELSQSSGLTVRIPANILQFNQLSSELAKFEDVNLRIDRVVSSTNEILLEDVTYDADEVSILLAESQLSGRGRRGKHWSSPFGNNIYLSFGFSVDVDPLSHFYPLRVAVALQAFLANLGVANSLVKWPNDIFVNDKKIAGILVESKIARRRQMIAIGIGLNVFFDQKLEDEIDQPVGFLQDYIDPRKLDRNMIAGELISVLLMMLKEPLSVPDLIEEWSASDMCKGKRVRLIDSGSEYIGTAKGLGQNGEYIVSTANGDIAVASSHSSIRLLE
jgi:BirA family biotin operon repressor/biotin-[acetyl-CoA-carboxylase] ligase